MVFRLLFVILLMTSCSPTEEQNIPEKNTKSELQDTIITTNPTSETSELTCPFCGNTTTEKLPEEYCLIRFDCNKCNKTIFPKDDDCCVFCSYGTHKCPSMQ